MKATLDPQVVELWGSQWRKYWRSGVRERHHFSLDMVHIEAYRSHLGNAATDRAGQEYLFVDFIDRQPPRDWWLISPTRETRVYVKQPDLTSGGGTGSSWLRTVPPESYWGALQTFETPNVRYEFPERDADLIMNVAPNIEAHHNTLLEILNLTPLEEGSRFTVRMAPHPRQGRSTRSSTLYLTSPLLASKPAYLSDEAYVERMVVDQLTALSVNRASNWRRWSDNLQWSTLIWALRSQLTERLTGAPSPWFIQSEPFFIEYGADRFPMALEEITRIRKPKVDPDHRHIFWQQIGAELVLDYGIEIHGTESIPRLIHAFNKSRNWEQLVQDTYGVSLSEFEQGFNHYLSARYGWTVESKQ